MSAETNEGSGEPNKFPLARRQSAELTRGIPDNPWVDDVGMIRDRAAHFKVDRLTTCNCQACSSEATHVIGDTYKAAFQKEISVQTGEHIVNLYEGYIQLARNARHEIPPKNDEISIFEKGK